MQRLFGSFILAAALGLTPGCATLLASGPSHVEVKVEGPTEGAVVTLQGSDGAPLVRKRATHFHVTLDRYASYAVLVTADGYEPKLARLRSDPHPVYFLNAVPELAALVASWLFPGAFPSPIFWGSVGASVAMSFIDDMTKSGRRHETQTLVIPLKKRDAATASPSSEGAEQ